MEYKIHRVIFHSICKEQGHAPKGSWGYGASTKYSLNIYEYVLEHWNRIYICNYQLFDLLEIVMSKTLNRLLEFEIKLNIYYKI